MSWDLCFGGDFFFPPMVAWGREGQVAYEGAPGGLRKRDRWGFLLPTFSSAVPQDADGQGPLEDGELRFSEKVNIIAQEVQPKRVGPLCLLQS